MFFSNPIWLWALTGLSIPVAIHLLSRKEGKVIYVGSIRHLQETSTQQFKGIRLNELALLALRCLLITLFVLLLSGLSFHKNKGNEAPWILVEKGLENSSEVKSQLEKFKQGGYEIRMFAPGFPLLADSAEATTPFYYKALIEALAKRDISEAIIFSKNSVSRFAGLRSSLPPNVKWIGVASESSEFTLTSYSSNDSTVTRIGHASPTETHFTTDISKSERNNITPQPIRINVVADKEHQYDKKVIEAIAKALEKESRLKIDVVTSTPEKPEQENCNWIIWLTDKPIPDFDSVPIIKLQPGIDRDILVQETTNTWAITKRLNEETALNENITLRLASVIIPSNQQLALEKDSRMVPDSIAWSPEDAVTNASVLPHQSADAYIIAIFLIILLVERILAYHKKQ